MPREQSIADVCGGALAKSPATQEDCHVITILSRQYFPLGTWPKRFVASMWEHIRDEDGDVVFDKYELTPKQRMWIWKLLWTRRKSLKNVDIDLIRKAGRYNREYAGQEPIDEMTQADLF